ncbi:hypothetical protein FKP32DRAFT_1588030 [Trametes sanguinea]|nr:hypothetical protein FKP32DRAFT_1588030 [Trametes sanguinea]
MPDLASLMSNPMMMQMAQQMMQNGGLERLMQNPALANMVGGHLSGPIRCSLTATAWIDEQYAVWRWHAVHVRAHV